MSFDRNALVEQLRKALDLTLYEAKLYLAILQGASDPKEASIMSGVPLPRIYDIVKVLESKGMVYKDPAGWYRAVGPRALAAVSIARLEEESRRRAAEIMALADTLEKVETRQGSPQYAIVKGAYNVISAAVDFFRHSVSAFITVSTVFGRDGLGERLARSLSPHIGDLRVILLEGLQAEAFSSLGLRVKVVDHPLVDSVASRTGLMVVLSEPTGEPVGVAVVDPTQAEPYFKGLSRLWGQ